MKVIAVHNLKGGVGKTTAAVNLAYAAAFDGLRTLIWDMDPQAAATFIYRQKAKVSGGAKKLLKRKSLLSDRVRETDYPNLHLLPADFSYRHLDREFAELDKANRMARLLAPLGEDFDLVVLDCPPSLSDLSDQIFDAADAVVVPLIPTPLSVNTYEQLKRYLVEEGYLGRKGSLEALLPFFSMVDRRKKLHRATVETFPATFPEVLPVAIPYSSVVEQMALERAPVFDLDLRSPAAYAFAALWLQIRKRLKV